MLRNLVDRLRTHLLSKQDAEAYFWRKEISRIQDWFNGTISLYNTPSPTPAQKVKHPTRRMRASSHGTACIKRSST